MRHWKLSHMYSFFIQVHDFLQGTQYQFYLKIIIISQYETIEVNTVNVNCRIIQTAT